MESSSTDKTGSYYADYALSRGFRFSFFDGIDMGVESTLKPFFSSDVQFEI